MTDQTKLKSILQTLFWWGVEAGLNLAERGVINLRVEHVHDAIMDARRDDCVEEATKQIHRLLK
jgi:hypothetical protein